MQPANVVQLPAPPRQPSVTVEGDRITVERLVLADRTLAAFVAKRLQPEQPELIERALRIGLLALQDAGTTLDVEFVRREFEALAERNQQLSDRASDALGEVLRETFADEGGRLPRTLERFLGSRGELRRLVTELFDENSRDSAIGRMRTLLGSYLDGDGSRLAQMLDPTRLGSPLHQFRSEMADQFGKLNERLTAIEASAAARAAERAKSAAKGADFEDLLEDMLAEVVRGTGDILDRIAAETGDVIRSRKGDFLLTVDPRLAHGADLRVVVEAKDREMSTRAIREELAQAKRNRAASAALVIFSPEHAPRGVAPFDVRGNDVYCVVDPLAPDLRVLEAALRLARLYALASIDEHELEIDAAVVVGALNAVRAELDVVRGLKVQLTSIRGTAEAVSAGLDRLRSQVLARISEAEAELRPAGDG
jgi:hypothetical protein